MNKLIHRIQNAVGLIHRSGILFFFNDILYRFTNYSCERRFGVSTDGVVKLANLGFTNDELRDYTPMGYKAIYAMLEKIPLDKSQCTFLDFGVGKGRAVVVAATLAFKRIIGIEISDELLKLAKENVDRMRERKSTDIELYKSDATQYRVPPDVNVIYFFNPFVGEVLQKVIDNIHASYQQNPRKIYIIFFNRDHFEKTIAGQTWIKSLYQTQFHPHYSCGLYVTK